jgi:FAD/FMN-containing dehydrogenase
VPINPAYLEDAGGFTGTAEELYIPATEEELCGILKDANERRIPVTIAGAGTGVTGGRVPQGGWVVSLERFTRVEIRDTSVVAGAGVLLRDLQKALAPVGRFYAPDPTETGAAVGGTIANNASGSRSFRCGDTRRNTLALRIAFMDGSIRSFSRGDAIDFDVPAIPRPATTKHSAGFPLSPGMDWVDLFIGSEGTLGVVTEATLRTVTIPDEVLAGVCFFTSDDDALSAVDEWRSVPRLRMVEYFDAGSLRLLADKYSDIPSRARAALLVEQEITNPDDIDGWEARLRAANALLEESWFADNDVDRERFRLFRHALPEAVNATVRQRGLMKMGTDFAVPIARNGEMLAYYRQVLEREFPGQYVIFGHIGDAHVHVNMLPKDAAESERAKALMNDFAAKAASLGGTVGAEHGLGKRKAHLLAVLYSREQIEAMRSVKRQLDPNWLLGRGTLFPQL